jgi:hypothetical protein
MEFLKIEYPYAKYHTKLDVDKIKQQILNFSAIVHNQIPNALKTTNEQLITMDDSFVIIEENWIKYKEINAITDLFTEKQRVHCVFKNNKSPYKYWNENKHKIIKKAKHKYKKINIYTLREVIYNNSKLCSNYRISLCLAILNIFKPKKWLDISGGWGDRLLSAIFYSFVNNFELYCSTDPNKDLVPGYMKMIDTFVHEEDKHKFKLFTSGFEHAVFPIDDFDIVFSSPPFFDLEIYSTHEGDSMNNNNTEESWGEHFLKPTLINSYNHLKFGGHIILYIHASHCVQKYLDKLSNIMKYQGIIYNYDANDKRNIVRKTFVWKKITDDKISEL